MQVDRTIIFVVVGTLASLVPATGAAQETRDVLVRRATDVKLNSPDRLAAIKQLTPFSTNEQQTLLRLFRDDKERDAVRIAALKVARLDDSFEQPFRTVLTDDDASSDLIVATLDRIPPGYSSFEVTYPKLIPAIRLHRSHTSERIRVRAIRLLVSYDDSSTIALVVRGLDRSAKKLIPDADAIRLLTRRENPDIDLDLMRPYLDADSPATRYEAVRALVLDSKSKPRIRAMAFDIKENAKVRTEAIRALRDPSEYLAILQDVTTPVEYLELAIGESIGYFNYNTSPKELAAFKQRMAQIGSDDSLPTKLREMALSAQATVRTLK